MTDETKPAERICQICGKPVAKGRLSCDEIEPPSSPNDQMREQKAAEFYEREVQAFHGKPDTAKIMAAFASHELAEAEKKLDAAEVGHAGTLAERVQFLINWKNAEHNGWVQTNTRAEEAEKRIRELEKELDEFLGQDVALRDRLSSFINEGKFGVCAGFWVGDGGMALPSDKSVSGSEREKCGEKVFVLHILVKGREFAMPGKKAWVAHCLELDLVAADDDKWRSVEKVALLINRQVEFGVRNNNTDHLWFPAPASYFAELPCNAEAEKRIRELEKELEVLRGKRV